MFDSKVVEGTNKVIINSLDITVDSATFSSGDLREYLQFIYCTTSKIIFDT